MIFADFGPILTKWSTQLFKIIDIGTSFYHEVLSFDAIRSNQKEKNQNLFFFGKKCKFDIFTENGKFNKLGTLNLISKKEGHTIPSHLSGIRCPQTVQDIYEKLKS